MRVYSKRLSRRFGSVYALRDLNLEIEGVSRVSIVGHNGSGKSTLLSIIYGILKPSSGFLEINGYKPYVDRERAAREMSIVFERPYFDVNLRVRDIYDLMRDYDDLDCVDFFWSKIGVKSLRDKELPDLSSGEKQLIQLMQALCRESLVKILDEPFSHLDSVKTDLVGSYILSRNFNIIFTTHVAEEAEWLGEYVVILQNGIVVWQGRIRDLWSDGLYEVFISKSAPEGLRVLVSLGYVAIVQADEELLLRYLEERKISGFKRLGVRRVYVKSS
ncbi:MAG: ABC transporter ATP-binding protein [Sulfolobales archaeon]